MISKFASSRLIMSVLLTVALLAFISYVSATEGHNTQLCESTNMKVILRSHYNETGSWQSKVVFTQEKGSIIDEHMPRGQWLMDIKQSSSVCDEGKSYLETTIYLTAPTLKAPQKVDKAGTPTPLTITEDPPISPAKLGSAPPAGYVHYPGVGYYKFHLAIAKWPDAQATCAGEGGHLVIINSQAERETIGKMFPKALPATGSTNPDQIHAGLKRGSDGKFSTISGVPIEDTGFSEWYPGQPSSGINEPCTSIMVQNITYNDISCFKQILPFICEIDLQ